MYRNPINLTIAETAEHFGCEGIVLDAISHFDNADDVLSHIVSSKVQSTSRKHRGFFRYVGRQISLTEFPRESEDAARDTFLHECAHLFDNEQQAGNAMPVDYDTYADGEALLGWLNATVQLKSNADFNANRFIKRLSENIQSKLDLADAEIAHLKMTLSPDGGIGDIAVINLVRNDFVPELSQKLDDEIQSAQLIINLRAEGAPEVLKQALEAAIEETPSHDPDVLTTLDHLEHFRPGRPEPTHRLESLS